MQFRLFINRVLETIAMETPVRLLSIYTLTEVAHVAINTVLSTIWVT